MNRAELLEIYRKYLYIENPHLIDVLAATYVTKELPGDPVWLIPMAPSGYGKTEYSRPYMDTEKEPSYDIFFLDQTTSLAFASGKAGADDLGMKLAHKNSFLIIPDMANIGSMSDEDKAQLFAVLRTMFDGYIKRDTGGKKPSYDGIHCNLVGLSTSAIERDLSLCSLMGTREIMYRLPIIYGKDHILECKSITDEGRATISRALRDFLVETKSNPWIEPSEMERMKIKDMAMRIAVWRAEGECDKDGYLLKSVEIESPKRLYTQLTKLWMGFKKLGLTRDEAFKRLEEIEKGSGNPLRERIFRILETPPEDVETPITLEQFSERFNVAESEVRKNLMILRSLCRIQKGGLTDTLGYSSKSMWYILSTDFDEV